MNERVCFLRPVTTVNEYGEQQSVWEEHLTCWATISANGGKREDTTGDMFLTQSLRMWTRYHTSVTDRMRVCWRGDVYAIQNLLPRYGDDQMDFTLTKIEDED